ARAPAHTLQRSVRSSNDVWAKKNRRPQGCERLGLRRRIQRIECRPERPPKLAQLRRDNFRAMTAGPPFHSLEKTLQRTEQSNACPRDAPADDDRFRIE